MSAWGLLSLLLVSTGVNGFKLDFDSNSQSHWEITETAILKATAQSCRALAQSEGRDFTSPASLTAESLLEACAAKSSARDFTKNIYDIQASNALVNFYDESFDEGKKHITDGLDAVKASIKKENYVAARAKLGEILHTLQDFYSHSNWIELGNNLPNSNLIKKDVAIGNIAAKDRPTCRNCTTDCTNNILEDILKEKLLTCAYFSLWPSNSKPKGKCSHGDSLDNTRHTEATGGINKDSVNSRHGHLHNEAAQVATDATYELLEDVRAAVGDEPFLRMMGVYLEVSPGKALCLVIDTTGSMGFDIEAVQFIAATIISAYQGSAREPSVYILVPFNDPSFGPVTRTTDFDTFKTAVNALVPDGGGDEPEMSLSALQLALSAAPSGSEIFLFTDATAKDAHLKNTIIALIESTRSVVNFIISKETLQEPVYTVVAEASGGQVFKGLKSDVYPAFKVFLDSSNSTLVTLLQIVRNSGKSETFTFTVHGTETNLIIFITGTSRDFTLVSPSGVVWDTATGLPTTEAQTVGNLLTLKPTTEAGQWEIRMKSTDPYTLKITAQSPIDFFFIFLKLSQVHSEGYEINTNRPVAGHNGTLLVILSGSDSATLKEVYLVYLSGSTQVKGNVTGQENNKYLVYFEIFPSEEFSVLVKLQKGLSTRSSSGTSIQRQSNTNVKASSISVTSESVTVFEPGSTIFINITVSTQGTGGTFTIRATDNQGFIVDPPSTITVPTGGSAKATVQMTAPGTTESGTEVTLTVEVEAPGASDMNYVVSRFTVLKEVTDRSAPVFVRQTPEPNCSDGSSTWQLSIRVTDNEAIERVFLQQGNGTLTTNRISGNESMLSYEASCYSPTVEIGAVDGVGNVGRFLYTTTNTTTTTTSTTTTTTAAQTTTTTTAAAPNTTTTTAVVVVVVVAAVVAVVVVVAAVVVVVVPICNRRRRRITITTSN